jgi:hypothetical protein
MTVVELLKFLVLFGVATVVLPLIFITFDDWWRNI